MKLFEYIPEGVKKEFLGKEWEVLEGIWQKDADYLSITKLEFYLEEIKSRGANYIQIKGANTDGGIEDILFVPVNVTKSHEIMKTTRVKWYNLGLLALFFTGYTFLFGWMGVFTWFSSCMGSLSFTGWKALLGGLTLILTMLNLTQYSSLFFLLIYNRVRKSEPVALFVKQQASAGVEWLVGNAALVAFLYFIVNWPR